MCLLFLVVVCLLLLWFVWCVVSCGCLLLFVGVGVFCCVFVVVVVVRVGVVVIGLDHLAPDPSPPDPLLPDRPATNFVLFLSHRASSRSILVVFVKTGTLKCARLGSRAVV